LLQRHPRLRADLVVAGLPDRGEPVSPTWLDQIGARVLIVADAGQPAMARAPRPWVERLRAGGFSVFLTSETGSLDLLWEGSSWQFREASGRRLTPDYWRTKAGSLPETR
jgi:hypothetical protein